VLRANSTDQAVRTADSLLLPSRSRRAFFRVACDGSTIVRSCDGQQGADARPGKMSRR
jgi:hypothetical protein